MNPNSIPLEIDTQARRIVVINTAFLGDLVLTISFISVLKQKFPQAKIILVCKKGIGDFFLKLKMVDEIQEVQKGSAQDYALVVRNLNQVMNDFVFCIHRSFRSYLFSIRIKTVVRVGYRLGFNFFGYDYRVPRDLLLPEPLRILQLLALIDGRFAVFFAKESKIRNFNFKEADQHMVEVPAWAQFPRVAIPPLGSSGRAELVESVKHKVGDEKHIAVFPGSVWNTKRWPLESFAQLVDHLRQLNYKVLLMGGAGEEIYGDEIVKRVGAGEGVVNLIGKSSVWESILVLNQCDLVVANDSASAHLAALLGKKILVFFGPTVLHFGYRPWGNFVYVLENEALACRPCGSHGHHECPIKTHECMKSIHVSSVLNKVQQLAK
ncbi:MAG: glycosyltransferase family 9 protein [Bdellovibrionaceae bacterium]|nr:glycosyltransferase family 9 protein [Pseudobdellovibrionaceae bacterium]